MNKIEQESPGKFDLNFNSRLTYFARKLLFVYVGQCIEIFYQVWFFNGIQTSTLFKTLESPSTALKYKLEIFE